MMLDRHQEFMESEARKWVGDLPEGWRLVRNQGLFDETKIVGHSDEEMLSVTIEHGIIPQAEVAIKKDSSNEDKSKYKLLEPGDLAYNKMRMWQGAIGRSEYRGIVSPAYVTLRPRDPDYSRYFHYVYRTHRFITEANRNSYGLCDDMNSLRYEHFKTIRTPVPPKDTVNRIVGFLDEKTAEIDAAVSKKRRLIDLLNEQKAILINRAVTKGLNPDAPMKDSGVDWIGDIPAHWDMKRVKHFAEILPGYAFPSAKFSEAETPVRLLRGININPSKTVWQETVYWPESEFEAHQRYALKTGDLVMGMDRPWVSSGVRVARISHADLPALLVQRVARIRANDGYSNDFLELLITSKLFLEYFEPILSGVSVPHISDGQIGNFTTAVPDIDEQCAIAEHCRGITLQYGRLIDMEVESISTLNEFKQTLIANAVTGKIKI